MQKYWGNLGKLHGIYEFLMDQSSQSVMTHPTTVNWWLDFCWCNIISHADHCVVLQLQTEITFWKQKNILVWLRSSLEIVKSWEKVFLRWRQKTVFISDSAFEVFPRRLKLLLCVFSVMKSLKPSGALHCVVPASQLVWFMSQFSDPGSKAHY